MSFFLLWNTKERSLKNVGHQIVSGPVDFHIFCPYNGSQWDLKPFDCKHSPKYSIFFWRKKCIQVLILGWTIPLSARTGFWLVRFMGLITHQMYEFIHFFDTELTLLLTFSYSPRRERRVAQVRTEPLGLKVKRSVFCFCHSLCRVHVSMHMGNVMRKLMLYCYVFVTSYFTLDFMNTFS